MGVKGSWAPRSSLTGGRGSEGGLLRNSLLQGRSPLMSRDNNGMVRVLSAGAKPHVCPVGWPYEGKSSWLSLFVRNYSYRSASIGLSKEALRAG